MSWKGFWIVVVVVSHWVISGWLFLHWIRLESGPKERQSHINSRYIYINYNIFGATLCSSELLIETVFCPGQYNVDKILKTTASSFKKTLCKYDHHNSHMSEQQFIWCPVLNSVHYCELGYMLAKCPKCAAVGSKEIFIINIRQIDIG